MRYIARLKHKKGFTLTELVVVIAIIALLMAALTAFSGPVKALIGGVDAKADAVTINNIVSNYFEHNLSYASQVQVYAGVNLSDAKCVADLNSDFEQFQKDWKTGNDRSYALVMHMEYESSLDPSGTRIFTDSTGNGYKFYEIPGTKAAPFSAIPQLPNDGSGLPDQYRLFADEFYGDYSFFVAADYYPTTNKLRDKVYLRFMITSYHFDGRKDLTNNVVRIKVGDASAAGDGALHYESVFGTGTDNFGNYTDLKTGSEDILFELVNYTLDSSNPFLKSYSESNPGDIFKTGFKDNAGNTHYGNDVVIFYNIRKYDYISTSS